MTRFSSSVVVAAFAVGSMLGADGVQARQQTVNRDAQLQQDFKKRVDAYMALHSRLEKQAPPLKTQTGAAEIKAHQDALAKRILAARTEARHGDVFTPEISALFRRLMYPELKGTEGTETKKSMQDDAPAAITLKVNAAYPDNAPLPTVPPNLLANLPQLPKDLEYRFIGRDLILRDVHANLIVDFIANAIR